MHDCRLLLKSLNGAYKCACKHSTICAYRYRGIQSYTVILHINIFVSFHIHIHDHAHTTWIISCQLICNTWTCITYSTDVEKLKEKKIIFNIFSWEVYPFSFIKFIFRQRPFMKTFGWNGETNSGRSTPVLTLFGTHFSSLYKSGLL